MAVNDGSLNASAGSPQLPNLLDSYGNYRPAWNVAGVDYHVGVPDGISLKDPSAISMQGVTVDKNAKVIYVTGDNVTLDGYNFSLSGGWEVNVQGANTTIKNSYFAIGSNNRAPITSTASASNMVVSYVTIDGNNKDPGWGGLISYRGNSFTVEFSELKNAGGDMIQQIDGGRNSTVIVRNNLIENGGMAPGAHGDYTQLAGGPFNVSIVYNTTVQKGGTTQGLQTEYVSGGEIAHNTMIGTVSYFTSLDMSSIKTQVTVHDNYFDSSGYGFIYPNAGPNDPTGKSVFVNNVNMKNGSVIQDKNATPIPPVDIPPPTNGSGSGSGSGTGTAPSAPTITSFSNDSGVAGDGITNDNTLTLTGKGTAGNTIKVFDGSKQVGSATVKADGTWSLTTSALADGKHSLTAQATDANGKTSSASAALAVTIDTVAPTAPTIVSNTAASALVNGVVALSGIAEANASVRVFDGDKQIGTATAKADGTWSFTTDKLAVGSHNLSAKAVDAAGNIGNASTNLAVTIPSQPTTPPPETAKPGAPSITALTNDSGVPGDGITNQNQLTIKGKADQNSTVKIFDGAKEIGTVKAAADGSWSFTSGALKDGDHSLTAKVVNGTVTSDASAPMVVTVDTVAPNAPSLNVYTEKGDAVSGKTTADHFVIKGTAEANSSVAVFDGNKQIGTATADKNGAWSFTTDAVATGDHKFTSTATDVAGNVSKASAAQSVSVDTSPTDPTSPTGSSVNFTDFFQKWGSKVTIKGTADANSKVSIFDGDSTKALGTVKAADDGSWSFTTSLSKGAHTLKAKVDGSSTFDSGSLVVGTSRGETLKSSAGNDLFVSNGGADTFVFAKDFGHDTIKDFTAYGRNHDVVQFSKSVFDNFADVLSHASQVGRDVVISAGPNDSLTLKNVKLWSLDKSDFHFA